MLLSVDYFMCRTVLGGEGLCGVHAYEQNIVKQTKSMKLLYPTSQSEVRAI